ncbi:MAG TPA: MEDS domain-containing protein [Chitinophagaceae bacterium]|nr:MEDS domain-containing protein [Chitinophagaceae bacterium]
MKNTYFEEQDMTEIQNKIWEKSPSQVFWGEIATFDHTVQIYENDKVFLNTLESFAGAGLIAGDSVIIIATAEHLQALKDRLSRHGFNMSFLESAGRFIGLDATDTLNRFMVNGIPDKTLFTECITQLIRHAKTASGRFRAFGEMVAVLWKQGAQEAAMKLEEFWNGLHSQDKFTLFCAYPKAGFTSDTTGEIKTVCCAHSKVIDGAPRPSTEVYYRSA